MLETYWRPHRDISMPPPTTERLLHYKTRMRGLSAKKYLLTFKGTLNRHPVRESLANLHNESAGILILDSSKQNAGYDFDDLTSSSKFTLVVRGDVEYSYRFTEAVCSGSVPIIIELHAATPNFSVTCAQCIKADQRAGRGIRRPSQRVLSTRPTAKTNPRTARS